MSKVVVFGDRLLVGLTVRGTEAARERGGAALPWQILKVCGGQVVDNVGFEDRNDAVALASVSAA